MKKRLAIAFLLVVALLAVANVVLAQDGEPIDPAGDGAEITDDDVNAIAETLYCPVCENVPLDVCGTQACADWRSEIRGMLEDGRSIDYIQQYFVDFYGRRVLATPEARGIDIVVWVLPVVGVVAGAAVLIVVLRRMAPGAVEAQQAVGGPAALHYDDLEPEYVERLEQEVREFASQT
jgi:cytochrome c-type biogenesis protein CcmH